MTAFRALSAVRARSSGGRLGAGAVLVLASALALPPLSSSAGAQALAPLPGARVASTNQSASKALAQALRSGARAGTSSPQIVMLQDHCPASSRLRGGLGCPEQALFLHVLDAAGMKVLGTTTLVDTVSLMATPYQVQSLRHSAMVLSVAPDAAVGASAPSPGIATSAPASASVPTNPAATVRLVAHDVAPAPLLCGTKRDPEKAPQALQEIRANQAITMGYDGRGVTVAVLADGIDPRNPDLLRNARYGKAGQPVITTYQDFSGAGIAAKTDGAEAFGDVSSIAAQGNRVYNVSRYVNPAVAKLLPSRGCYVKVVGAAPGASVLALEVIGSGGGGTVSSIVQAVQYAVQHGAKVINESFGGEQFPDTSLDVVRAADNAAVAAGVTVVASSGDSGPTNTIGSPASDPNVISVGASTTFRAYAQSDLGGFYNPAVGNGHWLSDNISALSSSGYTESGASINLVAPGEVNWALCSTNYKHFTGCKDTFNGVDNGLQAFGGTSEASPLVAAGAADVIEAYAAHHGGADPSPALVKEILCSTATDIGAPAIEQGAGLLNIEGAVNLAASIPASLVSPPATATTSTTASTVPSSTVPTVAGPTTTLPAVARARVPKGRTETLTRARATWRRISSDVRAGTSALPAGAARSTSGVPSQTAPPFGDLLVSPSEINVTGQPGTRVPETVSLTNTAAMPVSLGLSTRALMRRIYNTGVREFTLDPNNPTTNMGIFPIWSGVNEIYQTETFKVPRSGSSRLVFTADYQNSKQASALHVALYGPTGTYSGYSSPQGVGDFAEAEVANPQPGKWTAFFFTALNGAQKGLTGTSGVVQWDAGVFGYVKAAPVSPGTLTIGPGQTVQATVNIRVPLRSGDSDQSLVLSSGSGRTTVPITVRSLVSLGARGGSFSGVLTGGNGRPGSDAQTNTFVFNVPPGKRDLDVSVALATDPLDQVIGYLVSPDGQTLGYSSNYTVVSSGSSFNPKAVGKPVAGSTPYMQLYALAPAAGNWSLVLQWANPVTGNELTEPFAGTVQFNQVKVTVPGLPTAGTRALPQGRSTTFHVHLVNTGSAPAAYFLDPRQDRLATISLTNLNPSPRGGTTTLPISGGVGLPIYFVPPATTVLRATVTELVGKGPVSFDLSRIAGDPDVSSVVSSPAVTVSSSGISQSLQLTSPEVSPGLWALQPSGVGPYPAGGQPSAIVTSALRATTLAFDKSVSTPTGDIWSNNLATTRFSYLSPGQATSLKIGITPAGPVGSKVSGVIYVDEFALGSLSPTGSVFPDAQVIAAIPYSYTVGAP